MAVHLCNLRRLKPENLKFGASLSSIASFSRAVLDLKLDLKQTKLFPTV